MGVFVGSNGSILCFVEGKIVASVPVTKRKMVDGYKNHAENILVEALRDGKWTIYSAGFRCLQILKDRIHFTRKLLSLEENEFIILMGFILHKLKIWHFDDPLNGLFIAPRKK